MEDCLYVSCIKINGVPILPPLMTKDIKAEMSNYKQIAINVEKRLTTLRVSCEKNKDIDTDTIRKDSIHQFQKRIHDLNENLFFLDCNNIHQNTNETINDSFATETSASSGENVKRNSQWNGEANADHIAEYQINLVSDTCSRSKSLLPRPSTDECIKKILSMRSNTIDTVSDVRKPQVPKTLNITPLILNDSNSRRDEKHQKNYSNDMEDTPKLVRQGSYVLDSPSPILLAHMQMKQSSSTSKCCSEYVPTSCSNTVRRREWNIEQAKIEWENDLKGKDFVSAESLELCMKQKNCSSNTSHKMCKSVSSPTNPVSSFTMYPAARSVDCIQTMLANECMEKNNAQINHDRKCATENNNERKRKFQEWKKCNSFSTFQLAPKHDSFLENEVPFPNNLENEYNKVPTGDNFAEEISRNPSSKDFIPNSKLTITSDKLLTVYKKVQEMHKKQMAELMSRQQREQTLLQEEFEKQQLLLLTEIRKSFPEISVSLPSENILSTSFNQVTPNDEKLHENTDNTMENVKNLRNNLQGNKEVEHLQDNNENLISCLLDYTYTDMKLPKTDSCFIAKKDEVVVHPDKDGSFEKKLVEDGECKRLNVSRQLFPLDSKTVHVPILDKTIYGAKHIEAVNVINAYARGYLVRRMMRTERVIALKNTYKEALECMLKLHVDAPLNRSEFNFLYRLQLQCDAASMNIVELFAQSAEKRMQVISQDREIKQSRIERSTSARSYSFATQRTLARKKLKEMEEHQPSSFARSCLSRSRCQTWTSNDKDKMISPNILYHGIKRSTSAGTVRKPWR